MVDRVVEWQAFSAALTVTLSRMPQFGILTLLARNEQLFQFCRLESEMRSEVASTTFLEGECRLSAADEARLVVDGWTLEDNYHCFRDTPLPMRSAEYEELAALSVVVLRDLFRVASPTELTVEAARGVPDGEDPDVSAFDPAALDMLIAGWFRVEWPDGTTSEKRIAIKPNRTGD